MALAQKNADGSALSGLKAFWVGDMGNRLIPRRSNVIKVGTRPVRVLEPKLFHTGPVLLNCHAA